MAGIERIIITQDTTCPDCQGTGITDAVMDTWMGFAEYGEEFCHCITGEQMRRDYESDQVDREERERES